MPNQEIINELKQNQLAGNTKPSQLKKSRSAEDILPPEERIADLQKEITVHEHTNLLLNQENLQLRNTNQALSEQINCLAQEKTMLVDQNLELRLNALKSADEITQNQQVITQAANKYTQVQQNQVNYAVQNKQLLRDKADLTKQLNTAQTRIQKLYQLKGLPYNSKQETGWVKWLLVGLVAYGILA
jgi:chromosome segregation ATPase